MAITATAQDVHKKAFYEQVAETLIRKLEEGTAPWQKPWNDGGTGGDKCLFPMNPTTGKRYRGGNLLHLMAQERDDPRWMTYRQAANEGGQVRKGEHGVPVVYWRFEEERLKKNQDGSTVLDGQGAPVRETVRLERPRQFTSVVFNAEQIEGLPPLELPKERTWDPVERAEGILRDSGAKIEHKAQGRAYYSPSHDKIVLPQQSQFPEAGGYYDTALHELGHWTGHESRLNREMGGPFGSQSYAREELRAEIASMLLAGELGLPHNTNEHAAYVQSWIQVLREATQEVFRAASDAERVMEHVMNLEQKQVQATEQSQTATQEQTVPESALAQGKQLPEQQPRQYLFVPFAEKNAVKELGGKWDGQARQWYAPGGADLTKFSQWLEPTETRQQPETRPENQKEPHQYQVFRAASDAERVMEHVMNLEQKQVQATEQSQTATQEQTVPESALAQGKQLPEQQPRQYLLVPFAEKNAVKELGGKWDGQARQWYAPGGADLTKFSQWLEPTETRQQPETRPENQKEPRQYLAVSYTERREAKSAGAMWDSVAKSWYAGPGADMAKLEKWLPDRQEAQSPAMPPHEEFASVLRGMGCRVEGDHPIMDGQKHRIAVEGDNTGDLSGFYVGYLDGKPNGYAKNNRTGEEQRWKSKGDVITAGQRETLKQEYEAKKEARAAELAAIHERTAQRVLHQLTVLQPATGPGTEPTPYMVAKGVTPRIGAFVGENGTTCLPAQDADGKLWTMQYIQADGTKRFAKDGRKDGCFHAITQGVASGGDALRNAPVLVIAEGYATASSLADALGTATVVAFDAGNVVSVAKALREKYPDKPMVIAGDDDRHQPANPGRNKAELAARLAGAEAVFPVFAPGEDGKGFTDFNDLATKSTLGLEAVKRQLAPVIAKAAKIKQTELAHTQAQIQGQQRGHNR